MGLKFKLLSGRNIDHTSKRSQKPLSVYELTVLLDELTEHSTKSIPIFVVIGDIAWGLSWSGYEMADQKSTNKIPLFYSSENARSEANFLHRASRSHARLKSSCDVIPDPQIARVLHRGKLFRIIRAELNEEKNKIFIYVRK